MEFILNFILVYTFAAILDPSEGTPNVTLLKRSNSIWCVAQDEAAYSGLAWEPQEDVIDEKVEWITEKSALNCNFMEPTSCKMWTGWGQSVTKNRLKLPITDYRWNYLRVIHAKGETVFLKENNVALPTNVSDWEMTVSVNAIEEAHIVICKEEDPFTKGCYWILLGGWKSETGKTERRCALRRCPSGVNECNVTVNEYKKVLVIPKKWIHVTIYSKIAGDSQYLRIKTADRNETILEYNDAQPLVPKYLNVRSGNNIEAYFRIHNYTFRWDNTGAKLKSPVFHPSSSRLCVYILHYSQQMNTNLNVELFYVTRNFSETVIKLSPSEKQWRTERIIHNLSDGWKNGTQLIIYSQAKLFFAIGAVRECKEKGDVRISRVNVKSNRGISCRPLQYRDTNLTIPSPASKYPDSRLNMSQACNKFSVSELTNCSGVTICWPVNKDSTCSCSPGFKGRYCRPNLEPNEPEVYCDKYNIIVYWQRNEEFIQAQSKREKPCMNTVDLMLTSAEDKEPQVNLTMVSLLPSINSTVNCHPIRNCEVNFTMKVQVIDTDLRRNEVKKLVRNINITVPQQYNCSLKVEGLLPATKYRVSFFTTEFKYDENDIKIPVNAPNVSSIQLDKHKPIGPTSFSVIIPQASLDMTTKSFYFIIISLNKYTNVSLKEDQIALTRNLTEQIVEKAGIKEKEWWIAAEIQPQDKNIYFEVGNGSECNGTVGVLYRNQRLTESELYEVILVAVNQVNGRYLFSIVRLEQELKSLIHPALWASFLLLIIPIAGCCILWRRRKSKSEGDTLELKTEDELCENQTDSNLEISKMPLPVGPKLSTTRRFSRRVAIGDLENYVKIGLTSGELQRQHALFARGLIRPCNYGRLPQNKEKNRYDELVAYDDTRVKLKKIPGDPLSDYINANYINGYNSPKFYIATQGPKRNTVSDFWRMIWQEHVQVISILTNVVENDEVKCEPYWPESGEEITYGSITIKNESSKVFADYTFRILSVTCEGKMRKVNHLHFNWPENGVPLYPQSLASYLKRLLITQPGRGPIVVHCSAGVGRTGTVILADICLRMAAAEGYVDVLSFQQQIREQRSDMVYNLNQYKLVHLVLLESLVAEQTSIPCDGKFESCVEELYQSGTLLRQFNRLHDLRWQDEALKPTTCHSSHLPADKFKFKNRYQHIVPGTTGRIFISKFPHKDGNSDYINAVSVDGFKVKDQFVATQFPLPSTVGDFWRLIDEKNVSLIVVLNELDEQIKNVCKFWPTEENPSLNAVPYLSIRCKQQCDHANWTTFSITIMNCYATNTDNEKKVNILHLKGWKSDEELPPSAFVILELWQEAERLYNGNGPIVVTCLDGAKACGYFLSLAFLLDKIKLTQECDVCHAVRTVRQNREQFVPSYGQFELLYQAALLYLDSFQIYANFN
ncbi:receptor-type tyrosine-protein phosphatase T-like isoform X1 [Periplaneta americana]|uniref:receptor-type tyrosine-protein phosphatase T-like isoform X1 n=2 Tax=Periplaneta americana TaxID=6978 RepID=UPI0037E8E9F1